MTGQSAFLAALVDRLTRSGVPHMVSGSLASSLHGKPRATNDIDLVIDPDATQLAAFLASIPEAWYVSETAAKDALLRRTMFNVIDTESGWKADLIVRKDRPFSVEEFRRRVPADVLGARAFVVTPEDAILSKLEWSRESGSDRQFADAVGVAALAWDQLDRAYLSHWADELGLSASLDRLLEEAGKSRSG